MVYRPCPNDAMFIPQVAELLDGDVLVRFFWCWWCMELSAFVGDPGTAGLSVSPTTDAVVGGCSSSSGWSLTFGPPLPLFRVPNRIRQGGVAANILYANAINNLAM